MLIFSVNVKHSLFSPFFFLTSLSFVQKTLESATMQLGQLGWSPYVLAVQKAIEYTMGTPNVTASPEMVAHALDVALTAMNFSSEQIDSFLNSDIFTMPNSLPSDMVIKDLISRIIEMRLLGNWTTLYGIMEQLQYVENTSNILGAVSELVGWYNTAEDTGVYFGIQMLTKLYDMLTSLMPASKPLPCYSDLVIGLASNALGALQHISGTPNLFTPINSYLKPIQMQLALGGNLRDLVSDTQNTRRPMLNLTREPVDDFLDLLEINYQNLFEILSIPLSSEEMLETMHVFFTNPDLGIFLKGVSRGRTGSSVEDETIDTFLGTLAHLTLPSNGQTFMEMISQTFGQAWSHNDMQLAESLGGIVGTVRMLSQEPSLSVAQRVQQVFNQLTSAVSANRGNSSEIVRAINDILSQNPQQMPNTSLEDQSILQNIISSAFQMSGSQIDFGSYMMVMNQTAETFSSLVPPEEMVYFNISARMMEAFAFLMSRPTDLDNVVMSSHAIADSLALSFALSGMTTLPNNQSIQELAFPFILNSALGTEILFNLSASKYTFGSDLDRSMILTQITSSLPVEVQDNFYPLTSSLISALSNVSDTAQIRPAVFEISQNVSMFLLEHLNLTGDPMSTGLYSVLSTVSNEVSASLSQGLMENSPSVQLPYVLESVREIITSLSLELPVEVQQYPDVVFNFMETMALALNHTVATGDVASGLNMLTGSVQSLLGMIPNNNTDTSSRVMGDLENTVRTLLMVLPSGQDPLMQSANITDQILTTIQNLLAMANRSSETDLATAILGAMEMNVESLLATNDSNATQR